MPDHATDALALSNLSKRFGETLAVSDINLSVPRNQFVCFLGPSGCGKTTLLRLIAGLEEPSQGRIHLDGQDITGVPAHRRGLGMVFQSLALFPHLDVAGNITYSMRGKSHSRQDKQQRVKELLELVRLPDIAKRQVNQLSGGQQQRVAIARALAIHPKLFLLDEPLSALDAKLHEEMRVELRLLQQKVGITTIMVTHDQRDAMTMADLVVVLRDGKIQQVDSPLAIYRRPANPFVASFIGTSNILDAKLTGSDQVQWQGFTLNVDIPEAYAAAQAFKLSIRPEDVHIHPRGDTCANGVQGHIALLRDIGETIEIFVDCGQERLLAQVQPHNKPAVAEGDEVIVELPRAACVVLHDEH